MISHYNHSLSLFWMYNKYVFYIKQEIQLRQKHRHLILH